MNNMIGVSRATSLKALHATNNNLQTIPNELFSMTHLESLFLSYNAVTGSISRELSNLSNLKDLYLFGNQLTGTVPSELGNIPNLTEIVLAKNFLSGTLPQSLNSLSQLRRFSIYDQQGPELITGPVPSLSAALNLV